MELENIIDIDVELEETETIEVEIQEAGPKGDDGLSAYEIYLSNGGTLSELEWLDSLKGEQGEAGYSPVKGTDYWTEDDQIAIKNDLQSYFDEQLGVIENGTY